MISCISLSSWVTDWLPARFSMFHILTVPSPLPTKSLWPSREGQILVIYEVVRGSVSKIIFELVIETSHISTVRCFGTNTWLAWGEWTMAGGWYPTSRSKDTICLVSSFQRQLWRDSPNTAIKQSLVGEKWSDKRLTKGCRNRWVNLLSSKFHSSTTFWDTLPTARYCPLGENWATATPVTSNSLFNVLPVSHNMTIMRVGCWSSEVVEDPFSSIQCIDAIRPSLRPQWMNTKSKPWVRNCSSPFSMSQSTARQDNAFWGRHLTRICFPSGLK